MKGLKFYWRHPGDLPNSYYVHCGLKLRCQRFELGLGWVSRPWCWKRWGLCYVGRTRTQWQARLLWWVVMLRTCSHE